MRFKNRKGSTLALTIMIFAVLMIFATFTLAFMVTENKQAMYHQNKTQAYYIARSGVEVVEKAIRMQLFEYESEDFVDHSDYIGLFDSPGETIDVTIPGVESGGTVVTVHIENKDLFGNGKLVMTITGSAEYNNITQTVSKALYSIYSVSTDTTYKPGFGELFVSLGDNPPFEHSNNDRNIPEKYVAQLTEAEKSNLKKVQPFPTVSSWSSSTIASLWDSDNNGEYVTINNGSYGTPGVKTDIYVDGDLIFNGNVEFKGSVNIYVKGNIVLEDGANIVGEKTGTIGNEIYNLNVYSYNNNDLEYGLRTNGTSKALVYIGNLLVDKGKVDLDFHMDSLFDGSLIYNGTDEFHFSSTNNGNQVKLLTGSIYAPFATIKLGIGEDKVAYLIQGQVIGNMIEVYANNNGKGDEFYESSTNGRIGNPIPISVGTGKVEGLVYESVYLD